MAPRLLVSALFDDDAAAFRQWMQHTLASLATEAVVAVSCATAEQLAACREVLATAPLPPLVRVIFSSPCLAAGSGSRSLARHLANAEAAAVAWVPTHVIFASGSSLWTRRFAADFAEVWELRARPLKLHALNGSRYRDSLLLSDAAFMAWSLRMLDSLRYTCKLPVEGLAVRYCDFTAALGLLPGAACGVGACFPLEEHVLPTALWKAGARAMRLGRCLTAAPTRLEMDRVVAGKGTYLVRASDGVRSPLLALAQLWVLR